jgi:hypothetical protein
MTDLLEVGGDGERGTRARCIRWTGHEQEASKRYRTEAFDTREIPYQPQLD